MTKVSRKGVRDGVRPFLIPEPLCNSWYNKTIKSGKQGGDEMSKYEIIYDYDNGFSAASNIRESFDGDWTGLQEFIKRLREDGAYNIDASAVEE